MLKKLFLFLFCFCTLPLGAEVSVLTVTDEDKHQTKEDFQHTYEYFIISDTASMKCQATRITSRWFATAAHCVKDPCQNQCKIQMDLMDTPVSLLAQGMHDKQHKIVFVHPGYNPNKMVKDDFALIKLDVRQAPKIYYRRATKKGAPNMAMKVNDFFAWLKPRPSAMSKYNKALHPTLPPLVDFSVPRNYEIDRKLSVISIFDGERNVKKATSPVYYVKGLGYAYTNNFGIRKGMSGSGVMSNTGELIGIISSNIGETWYKGDKKVSQNDWFMFPVFNEDLLAFMKTTMGSDFDKIDFKDAYPSFVKKTKQDFSGVENTMQRSAAKKSTK